MQFIIFIFFLIEVYKRKGHAVLNNMAYFPTKLPRSFGLRALEAGMFSALARDSSCKVLKFKKEYSFIIFVSKCRKIIKKNDNFKFTYHFALVQLLKKVNTLINNICMLQQKKKY